jgi:hypothetical protein
MNGGAQYCTAFTYVGATNGIGPGTCYLKNGVAQNTQSTGDPTQVTAVRVVNFAGANLISPSVRVS